MHPPIAKSVRIDKVDWSRLLERWALVTGAAADVVLHLLASLHRQRFGVAGIHAQGITYGREADEVRNS